MLKLQKLNLEAKAKGYKVIGMTASSPLHCQSTKKYGLTFDFYFAMELL
jgi:hypothetical protein